MNISSQTVSGSLSSLSSNSRSEPFNDGNLGHEMELLQLWTLLKPDTPLEKRVTKQWQSIGK